MTIFNRNRVVEIARVELASSASVPSSKNRYDQKGRAPSSKSQESVSGTKTYPTCPKFGKNHPGECLVGKEGCFGCGQSCHRLRVISLGNRLRKIRRLGLGTMTILSRNLVMEISRRVSRSFQLQPLHHLMFHPPRKGMITWVEH